MSYKDLKCYLKQFKTIRFFYNLIVNLPSKLLFSDVKKIFFSLVSFLKPFLAFIFEFISIPFLFLICMVARFCQKKIDVGLGPEPLINNIHHKKALKSQGYTAETFVFTTYCITQEFDIILEKKFNPLSALHTYIACMYLFIRSIFKYKAIFIYFHGGPLSLIGLYGFYNHLFWKIEPYFYKIARVKTIVMPYGGDVNDLSRCPNLLYTYAISKDYPKFRTRRKKIEKKLDLWISQASHIISGCDWVYYTHQWDTLMLGHFSIDTNIFSPSKDNPTISDKKTIKILHAPNHRELKGTKIFIKTIEELQKENYPVELKILERKHNSEIKKAIEESDIIADQLIIGWYAMFAIEAMSLEKPVLCFLRNDLIELYEHAGLVKEEEIPIINCNIKNVKFKIKELLDNPEKLKEIGKRSREFVLNHHSLDYIGKEFSKINKSLGIYPQNV
jgi:glycosyltransferase involved in cell wall biosynthesis